MKNFIRSANLQFQQNETFKQLFKHVLTWPMHMATLVNVEASQQVLPILQIHKIANVSLTG